MSAGGRSGAQRGERGVIALLFVIVLGVVITGAVTAFASLTAVRGRAARERLALVRAITGAESLIGFQLQRLQDAERDGEDPPLTHELAWGTLAMEEATGGVRAWAVHAAASYEGIARGLQVALREPVHAMFRKSLYAGNRHGGANNLRFGPDRLRTTRRFASDHPWFDGRWAGVPGGWYVDAAAVQLPEELGVHRDHTDGVYPFAYTSRMTYGGDDDWQDARVPVFQDVVDQGELLWQVTLGESGEDRDGDGIDDGEDDGFTYGSYSVGTEDDARTNNYVAEWDPAVGPDPQKRYQIDFMPDVGRVYVWDVERYMRAARTDDGNEGVDGSVSEARVSSTRGDRLLAVYGYSEELFGEVRQEYDILNRDEVAGSVFVNAGAGQETDAITVGVLESTYPYRDTALLAAYQYKDVVDQSPMQLPSEIAAEGAIGAAAYSWSNPYSQRLGDATVEDLALESNASIAPGALRIEPPDLSEVDYLSMADVVVSPPVAGPSVFLEDGATYNTAIRVQSAIAGVTSSSLCVKPVDWMKDPMADIPTFVKDQSSAYDPETHDNYFFTLGSYREAFQIPSSSAERYLAWDEIPGDMRLRGTKYNRMLVPTELHRKLVYVDGNLLVEPDGARVIMDAALRYEHEGQEVLLPWWSQPLELTIVVKGNIYLADAVMASSANVGLVLIALEDDGGSYEDLNSNGRRDDGEPLTPGSTAPPREGSGNIYFGDTNADDPIGASTAYLFAQNDFHVIPPADPNRQQTFGVVGNMTAGNKIHFGDRGRSNLFVQNDVRLLRDLLRFKGLPKGFRFVISSWAWLAQTEEPPMDE